MAIGDADMESGVFFEAFGVPVVFGGRTVKGNFDEASQDAVFGDASVDDVRHTLLLAKDAFSPMPVSGDLLVVEGVQFKVRSSGPADDGALIQLRLKAA